jgi:hypothetical protein
MPVAYTRPKYRDNPDEEPGSTPPTAAAPTEPARVTPPAPANMMEYMMYRDAQREEREERERRARATPVSPAVRPGGASTASRLAQEMESFAREQQAIQAVMAKFQPAPNPVMQILDTEFGGKIGEVASTGISELIKMWKEERMMKRAADEAARYSKQYDEMVAKYERVLQLKMQAGDTSAIPMPAPPQSMGMPGFPAPSGMAGQAIGLAQAYGQMPGGQGSMLDQAFGGAPPQTPIQPDPAAFGGFPGGQGMGGMPSMGHSRPRVSMSPDSSPGGFPGQPGFFGGPQQGYGQQGYGQQVDPMQALRDELARTQKELADARDNAALQKPASAPLTPRPAIPQPPQPNFPPNSPPAEDPDGLDESISIEGEGVDQTAEILAQENPAPKRNPKDNEL